MSSSQPYILAIDQGTTGTTVIILNRSLEVHARVNREFPQIYPRPGWVEHDPEQIWATTLTTIREALASASLSVAPSTSAIRPASYIECPEP